MPGINQSDNHREYLPYMKLWADEWLTSSIHYNCTLEEQGFFVALMALASKNRKERGCLSLEVGQPMPDEVIANALYVGLDLYRKLVDVMIKQDRVAKRPDGVLYIKNFEYYQNKYRRGKRQGKEVPEVVEEKERSRLHQLQSKFPDEIKREHHPVFVNKDTGEVLEVDE